MNNKGIRNIIALLEQSAFVSEADDDSNSEVSDDDENDIDALSSRRLPFDQMLLRLEKTIKCLNDLNKVLATAALDIEGFENDTPSYTTPQGIGQHQIFSNAIRERFSEASSNLTDHLGKVNLNRYRILCKMRAESKEEIEAEPLNVTVADSRSKFNSSEFQDSGYVSGANPKSYALSVVSSASSGGVRSKYSLLPKDAKDGHAFECIACGRRIVARSNIEYRYARNKLSTTIIKISQKTFER